MKHKLSYSMLQRLAQSMYNEGGDVFVECWSEKDYQERVQKYGYITVRKFYTMCKNYADSEREQYAMMFGEIR